MKTHILLSIVITLVFINFSGSATNAQESASKRNQKNFDQKNIIYLKLDTHVEQRGENSNMYSNPEVSIGYDRKVFGVGKNHFFVGIRTGLYRETALTAWNYDEKNIHPFVGLYPSYLFAPVKKFKIQIAGAWDVIFETNEDCDDFWWWYFGIEPSIQFYPIDPLYISIGGAMGTFPWFEPPVTMMKAFVKVGYCF
ncbi:MAG: hypothetical protein JXB24_13190 [Bacteroidales bacterium]|nr:hypothetical protein [Bacteroidales bacterium]